MKHTLVTLSLFAVMAVVACGGTPAPAGGATILLHLSDAGKTFNVHGGDTVRIVLDDNYPVPGSSLVWNVSSSPASVLELGTVTRSKQVSSGPGRTDTYTAEFHAVSAGQAVLDAKGATTCEAMAKPACPDQHFTITVVVGR
jgi:predicted secreted protein